MIQLYQVTFTFTSGASEGKPETADEDEEYMDILGNKTLLKKVGWSVEHETLMAL